MMTDQEVMEALRSDTPFNRARREFSAACGRIEQAGQQRSALSPIEMRRMEFEAVRKIEAALNAGPRAPLAAVENAIDERIEHALQRRRGKRHE
jgi:hypothetical protein